MTQEYFIHITPHFPPRGYLISGLGGIISTNPETGERYSRPNIADLHEKGYIGHIRKTLHFTFNSVFEPHENNLHPAPGRGIIVLVAKNNLKEIPLHGETIDFFIFASYLKLRRGDIVLYPKSRQEDFEASSLGADILSIPYEPHMTITEVFEWYTQAHGIPKFSHTHYLIDDESESAEMKDLQAFTKGMKITKTLCDSAGNSWNTIPIEDLKKLPNYPQIKYHPVDGVTYLGKLHYSKEFAEKYLNLPQKRYERHSKSIFKCLEDVFDLYLKKKETTQQETLDAVEKSLDIILTLHGNPDPVIETWHNSLIRFLKVDDISPRAIKAVNDRIGEKLNEVLGFEAHRILPYIDPRLKQIFGQFLASMPHNGMPSPKPQAKIKDVKETVNANYNKFSTVLSDVGVKILDSKYSLAYIASEVLGICSREFADYMLSFKNTHAVAYGGLYLLSSAASGYSLPVKLLGSAALAGLYRAKDEALSLHSKTLPPEGTAIDSFSDFLHECGPYVLLTAVTQIPMIIAGPVSAGFSIASIMSSAAICYNSHNTASEYSETNQAYVNYAATTLTLLPLSLIDLPTSPKYVIDYILTAINTFATSHVAIREALHAFSYVDVVGEGMYSFEET